MSSRSQCADTRLVPCDRRQTRDTVRPRPTWQQQLPRVAVKRPAASLVTSDCRVLSRCAIYSTYYTGYSTSYLR